MAKLTTVKNVGILANVKAELIHRQKSILSDGAILELVIWRVRHPVEGVIPRCRAKFVIPAVANEWDREPLWVPKERMSRPPFNAQLSVVNGKIRVSLNPLPVWAGRIARDNAALKCAVRAVRADR